MATLVIGGGGFVGLNIAEHLLAQGLAVTVFDRSAPPEAALTLLNGLPGTLTVVTGDVTEDGAIAAALTPDTDTLIYGAAITAGPTRDHDTPEITMAVNLNGFQTALRAARDAKLRRVINLSSAGAYGEAAFRGTGPLHETDEADPQNIYGITKFASERVGTRMAEVWGLDVINVRLAGVFGKWERRTGARDTPSPQFQILEALQAGTPAVLERRDARDWIYGPDVGRVIGALMTAPALQHRLYNVSSGAIWSVLDWGQAMATRFAGGTCRLAEPGEAAAISLHVKQDRRALNIDRLRADLDLQLCTDIEQSVENYAEWVLGDGKNYK